ncbi:hypothetical protein Daus18300_004593 [Diaporthe australafricana]|uniref:Uncharacterized protein n=1 Tax=Diaporthe australafricana TaxID=127596 RepID=A0ABR3X7M8_9PEZI
MAGISHIAGPEWAYLAPRTKSNGSPTELDSLFVNVIVQQDLSKPDTDTKAFNLQTLITEQGLLYRPHNVTRFSFTRLRELTGSGALDLLFYDGAMPGVEIPDEPAFQGLLLAVRHLGVPTPQPPSEHVYAPPVLRFFARPKPPPKKEDPDLAEAGAGLAVHTGRPSMEKRQQTEDDTYNARQDETRQDETRRDKTRQDKTKNK